ncbi:Brf1, TBP-binding domain [Dillenia turbinata]|uniref:Brf1, TBP-binding domain n=1 Tax=Dillenia turbinata TaxID=194707 RepID=A0AAN8VI08_9MAGN
MVWCSSCARNCATYRVDGNFLCCSGCGKVIEQDNFAEEPTFVKNAAGQSQLAGTYVRSIQNDYSASRERTLKNGEDIMRKIIVDLNINNDESVVRQSMAFYTIAVERNFTRGRWTDQVAASCLYISCRENKKPYLLIDFSDQLRVNVYVLGAVFLKLCKLLSLQEHPFIQKPVDPSLFIHRFTDGLLRGMNVENYSRSQLSKQISKTALRLVASMKRDWIQTGRKPSGLCGAAIYVSCLSHGINCSKSDVISVVHICEATLTKRLIEFENTDSGSSTIEEFNIRAEELEREQNLAKQPNNGMGVFANGELLCEHKGSGRSHFSLGLCRDCYNDFVELSGGLDGGSEPPAFQEAERKRMMEASAEKNSSSSNLLAGESKTLSESRIGNLQFTKPGSETTTENGDFNGNGSADSNENNEKGTATCDESETLSDIDDSEVDIYLHNEEEKHYKKIIWEEMNKEYLQEQAAKAAEEAARKEAYEANFMNDSEDVREAKDLAAAAAEAVARTKMFKLRLWPMAASSLAFVISLLQEKQRKRAADAKNMPPARTAAEATQQILTKKRLSSKINFDNLEKLFDESVASEKAKKSRIESQPKDESSNKKLDNNFNEDLDDDDEDNTGLEYGEDTYTEIGKKDFDDYDYDFDDYD